MRNFSLFFSIVVALIAVSSSAVFAAGTPASNGVQKNSKLSVALNPEQGSVEFLAIGRPSALKIRGTAKGAEGVFEVNGANATGEAKFLLQGLDTGIAMRTQHMKDKYLEVGKFPEARLKLVKLTLPMDSAKNEIKAEAAPFEGTLLLHGVEKPVAGKVTLLQQGDKVSADAAFTLKISDHGIAKPGYAGITMAEDVDVTVKFVAPLLTK
jgi:polyisoprenoid-binding protein YceI